MKHIALSFFFLYPVIINGLEIGSVIDVTRKDCNLVSFVDNGSVPEFKQKVIVKYKEKWICGEVIAIFGLSCWVGVRTANKDKIISRGLIKRYPIKHVYSLSTLIAVN